MAISLTSTWCYPFCCSLPCTLLLLSISPIYRSLSRSRWFPRFALRGWANSSRSLGQGRDLEKKFAPSLLNTAIYLLGLSQQVSTFVLNFQVSRSDANLSPSYRPAQGRPFREGIRENRPLFLGLLGVSAVAYSGATAFVPELNSWLQLVDMTVSVSSSCCSYDHC